MLSPFGMVISFLEIISQINRKVKYYIKNLKKNVYMSKITWYNRT